MWGEEESFLKNNDNICKVSKLWFRSEKAFSYQVLETEHVCIWCRKIENRSLKWSRTACEPFSFDYFNNVIVNFFVDYLVLTWEINMSLIHIYQIKCDFKLGFLAEIKEIIASQTLCYSLFSNCWFQFHVLFSWDFIASKWSYCSVL